MRRREFLFRFGGVAASLPLAAHAQQTATPTIGLLGGVSPEGYSQFVTGLLQGLKEGGFADGANLRIEQRWARGQLDQVPALAADLVQRRAALLITVGGTSVAVAVQKTGTKIPLVFAIGSDPVEDGLVATLNRPGGTTTGVTFFTNALLAKRLELLQELAPRARLIGALVNPKNARATRDSNDIQEAARHIGASVVLMRASTADELDTAFDKLTGEHADALLVTSDAFFTSRREQLAVLAARHAVPAIYGTRDFAAAGGLVSYGADVVDSHRQAGAYAARILKGEKPGDLPVMQPTKFDLVLNIRTAKALGLVLPATLLARADEVIE